MKNFAIILGLSFLIISCNQKHYMQQSWQPKTPKLQQTNTYKKRK